MGTLFSDIVMDNNRIWFTLRDCAVLCEINEDKGDIIINLDNQKIIYPYGYGSMAKCNGKLVIAPYTGDNVHIYDIEHRNDSVIKFSAIYNLKKLQHEKFKENIVYENSIYFMGLQFPGIMEVNIENNKISLYKIDSKLYKDDLGRMFGRNSVLHDRKIYTLLNGSNILLCFDIDKKIFDYIYLDCKDYISVSYADEKIWMVKHNLSGIGVLSLDTKAIETINIDIGYDNVQVVCGAIYQNRKLWIIPLRHDYIYAFDIDTYNIKVIYKIDNYDRNNVRYYLTKPIDENHIACFNNFEGGVDIIDSKEESIDRVSIETIDNIGLYMNMMDLQEPIREGIVGLSEYLNCIKNEEDVSCFN